MPTPERMGSRRALAFCLLLGACEATPLPPPEADPAFDLPREAITLLPFRVRLAKVAAVAGVSPGDPILHELERKHLELGDHDYGAGVAPDQSGSAAQLALWVRGLKPVCDSTAMRSRFPSLPGDLDLFFLAAHGRALDDLDRAEILGAIEGRVLDEPALYRTICTAVLSSAEMVMQ